MSVIKKNAYNISRSACSSMCAQVCNQGWTSLPHLDRNATKYLLAVLKKIKYRYKSILYTVYSTTTWEKNSKELSAHILQLRIKPYNVSWAFPA